jgi:hypothetical protein
VVVCFNSRQGGPWLVPGRPRQCVVDGLPGGGAEDAVDDVPHGDGVEVGDGVEELSGGQVRPAFEEPGDEQGEEADREVASSGRRHAWRKQAQQHGTAKCSECQNTQKLSLR